MANRRRGPTYRRISVTAVPACYLNYSACQPNNYPLGDQATNDQETSLEQVTVRRTFNLTGTNGASREVELILGTPRSVGEDWEWFTEVEILIEGEKVESMNIFGVDSMGSMLQALWIGGIRIRVHQSNFAKEGDRLTWFGDDDLGMHSQLD